MPPKSLLACTLLLTPALLAHSQAQSLDQTQAQQDKLVHLNQIQVIGSHNSYHAGFAPSEAAWLNSKNPKAFRSLDYHHAPLGDQLSGGVRQVEIDIFADPQGGRYSHLAVTDAVAAAGLPLDPPVDPNHELDKPGFKVMHVQGLDERATCHTFVVCLTAVRTWSKQHPGHLPLFILVETKEGGVRDMPTAPVAEPFTPALFDAVDAEIRTVFKPGEIITPDEVRGASPTLNAAIKAGKWPTLARSRGRVIFLMDQKKAGPIYAEGHPSLRGRILFTNAVPGNPDAAFIEENDGSPAEIDALVREGYLIRTRTDEPTEAARNNDTRRRDLALTTGAQMLSTDYPTSEPARWPGNYAVGLPNNLPARCNPINKPATCTDTLLEPTR